VHDDDRQVTGMRAIALALIARAIAIAIQILAIFKHLGESERVVTALMLVFASVQIILTRPRAEARADLTPPPAPEGVSGPLEDPGHEALANPHASAAGGPDA
jgi:hypothetical protein